MPKYTIGLDYGTNSVRALIVNVATGKEISTASWIYAHGTEGIILSDDTNLARQHPADYIKGAETTIKRAVAAAKRNNKGFSPQQVIAIGVAATGSTPMPVDRMGQPLALQKPFDDDLAAMAWLWKDHTTIAEADEITHQARRMRPQYLNKCGGAYSSEWFFSKILHCLRHSPKVFDAAYTWVELSDWIPAMLSGTTAPEDLSINICAAGHKAMYNDDWGGYPDEKFLLCFDPKLGDLRSRLRPHAKTAAQAVGGLSAEWAKKTSLPAGIPIAAGAIDGHLGAVGTGITPGMMSKIIGTSSCDMVVVPTHRHLPDIPGLCGIVTGSIVPGLIGLEAGQAAVGDIFNWFANTIHQPDRKAASHTALTAAAAKLPAGWSGLLGLDWHHGNRSVLADQLLTGMMVGQNLRTTPAEIYRALIEASAFGALTIINRLDQYNIKIDEIVNCGGIAEKNPLAVQIYADVTNRPMKISRSSQTCALGAAIAAATACGHYESIPQAQGKMTGLKKKVYTPDPQAAAVYKKLYVLYKQLHDAFGTTAWKGSCHNIMKKLLEIRTEARK
ncbi:MAG: ribulokinase [Phycisphaerae bacterium]|nr:ribulokinase [Phycisphaerae bacterium]